jgi:hypothetical protein
MTRNNWSRAHALASDERGASIVELALLMPILGTMLLGMADLGQAVAAKHDLQRAANRAIELANTRIVTIDPTASIASYEFVRVEAKNEAAVADDQVKLSRWRECNGVPQLPEEDEYNKVCGPAKDEHDAVIKDAAGNEVQQEVARYLKVDITSEYEPLFSFGPIALSSGANSHGKLPIKVSAAVRIQ